MELCTSLEERLGIYGPELHHNLDPAALFEAAVFHDRGRIRPAGPDSDHKAFATAQGVDGPLVFYTDPDCSGRPTADTFAVAWPEIKDDVWWKSDFQRFDPRLFPALLGRVLDHVNGRAQPLYVQDVMCGASSDHAVPYRFIGEYATHALFARRMFLQPTSTESHDENGWTMLNVPSFECDPGRDGTASGRAVIIDFRDRIALVLGRADYCGIIKKTMFTVMNYLLPSRSSLPMHCAANVGGRGDGALLFGLSGTGKTTLSADPARQLIGDDEHAWSTEGVFNFEGGCYAKLIDLDKSAEPVIASALSLPAVVIENVPNLPDRALADTDPQELDLSNRRITENTRICYPVSANANTVADGKGPHPETLIFLTADAFGVLPAVACLSPEAAEYHFVSGFTAKVGGTEVGVNEPKAVFSPCFGAPFMPRPPSVYANMLSDKMRRYGARCILLNTGWFGGAYRDGERIPIKYTSRILSAALSGLFDEAEFDVHPIFNLAVPRHCPGVPDEILNSRALWDNTDSYDAQARKLRDMFRKNYHENGLSDLGIKPAM